MELYQADKAILLLQQGKYSLAEKEFRAAIAQDSENEILRTNLALTLLNLKRYREAEAEAKEAIKLDPETPLAFYVLSLIYLQEDKLDEAEKAINEAWRLDVNDPDYRDVAATICFNRKEWKKALKLAESGLALDPEHVGCLNTRARAMNRLGMKTEASESLENSFRHEPENAYTHINQGYVYLEQQEHKKALEHFQEALRLNPESDEAREGLVEALKAKYWIYRAVLAYSYKLGNMSSGARYGMYFGIYVLVRFVPFLLPLYLLLIFFNWFSDLIFNTLLRFNSYGRNALSKEQINGSNAFIGMIASGITAIVAGSIWQTEALTKLGLVLLALLFPLAGTLGLANKQDRKKSFYAGLALAALGAVVVVTALFAPDVSSKIFLGFLLCTLGYTWYRQSL